MIKIHRILLALILIVILYSCGSAKEAGKILRNEKTKSTDEFLVKKREPLIMPPDFNDMPKPGKIKTTSKDDSNEIDKILKIPKEDRNISKKSSTVEQSIINEIGK